MVILALQLENRFVHHVPMENEATPFESIGYLNLVTMLTETIRDQPLDYSPTRNSQKGTFQRLKTNQRQSVHSLSQELALLKGMQKEVDGLKKLMTD